MNLPSYLYNKGLDTLPRFTTVYVYGDKKAWTFSHMSDNGFTVWLCRAGEIKATRGTTPDAVYVRYFSDDVRWTGTRFAK